MTLVQPTVQSCPAAAAFLAPMRTQLAFDAAGPGLPTGSRTSDTDAATGAVTYTQNIGVFMRKPPGTATAYVMAGALRLGGSLRFTVKP